MDTEHAKEVAVASASMSADRVSVTSGRRPGQGAEPREMVDAGPSGQLLELAWARGWALSYSRRFWSSVRCV